MDLDHTFMEEALTEAIKASQRGDYGIGAVVVFEENIIARRGSEAISRGGKAYAHAEFLALDDLRDGPFDTMEKYQQMTVYTTMEPCVMCWGRMLVTGVGEIVYAAADTYSTLDYAQNTPPIWQKVAPTIRRLEGDIAQRCNEIFTKTSDTIDRYIVKTTRDEINQ